MYILYFNNMCSQKNTKIHARWKTLENGNKAHLVEWLASLLGLVVNMKNFCKSADVNPMVTIKVDFRIDLFNRENFTL